MHISRWRIYSKYLSAAEILEELSKMQKEEKIEVGDWVRVIDPQNSKLNKEELYKVSSKVWELGAEISF